MSGYQQNMIFQIFLIKNQLNRKKQFKINIQNYDTFLDILINYYFFILQTQKN